MNARKDENRRAEDRAAADRVAGAIMGAFIGDALGLGLHWYYDLGEMRRVYGEWISGYTNQSFREVYASRVVQHKPWGATGGYADTSEAFLLRGRVMRSGHSN